MKGGGRGLKGLLVMRLIAVDRGIDGCRAGERKAHLEGRFGGLEGHGVLELPLRRLGQLDAEHLGELLLRQLQAQGLERRVKVRVVAVAVPRDVLEDLLQRVRLLCLWAWAWAWAWEWEWVWMWS